MKGYFDKHIRNRFFWAAKLRSSQDFSEVTRPEIFPLSPSHIGACLNRVAVGAFRAMECVNRGTFDCFMVVVCPNRTAFSCPCVEAY